MLLIIVSLQIGAYSANKEIKHLMFSCDIFSFLFYFLIISSLMKVKNSSRHLNLHYPASRLTRASSENRPRKGEPARKLLIFGYPAFAEERRLKATGSADNIIMTKTMNTRHKHIKCCGPKSKTRTPRILNCILIP